ncbi:alanyl-tRNA editing protein [Amantichitinum ursilacus]|uniref:Alanine--tRNA ligase n=1 Tax=Amantichitinum ursilacus TaxID=857265 RepID=A0A0N0GL24_9NEIS|nr:alanyl-tRNA editing protein [Amantichitinum ursilacus]KPC49385.1 Alanine--tRNA ligase [Amantichitinum ursilacus]
MTRSRTQRLFEEEPTLMEASAQVLGCHTDGSIVLDRTIFCPRHADLPGDVGWLHNADGGAVRIVDTRVDREEPGLILHLPEQAVLGLAPGASVTLQVDWIRRLRHMRMHTALHLLCAVVPTEVQASAVTARMGFVDFAQPKGPIDTETLTGKMNELIARDLPVRPRWLEHNAALKKPDIARYLSSAERMGSDPIRVVDIAGLTVLPCGGPHVKRTSQIGRVRCNGIERVNNQAVRITLAFEEDQEE